MSSGSWNDVEGSPSVVPTSAAEPWDVVIVGARCAGAATALRFARSGRSVLVLDRADPARHTLSSHVLVAPAVARLDDLGLLAQVLATGAPPVRAFLFEFGAATHARPVLGPRDYLLSVRRTVLDPLHARAAAAAGATVRTGVQIEDLPRDGDRVTGVRGRDVDGQPFAARARLVVGADGRHSIVARRVGAPESEVLPSPSGAVYAYYRGVGPSAAGADAVQFAAGPACDVLCCPCDGALHVVVLIVGAAEFPRLAAGGSAAYEARLAKVPTVAPRLTGATRVGGTFAASPRELRGYFRHPFGPGWALVGDAGYYAHPAAANGIADALRAAELVHGLVEKAWAAGGAAEEDLEEYRRTRDAENTGAFHFSYRLGQVNPFADPTFAASVLGPQSDSPTA
jgi:2-polyprenyl-6-methoxyphenol hydroxylase-like FAD-dependent oxidoreductase